jgi:hypothetical protein
LFLVGVSASIVHSSIGWFIRFYGFFLKTVTLFALAKDFLKKTKTDAGCQRYFGKRNMNQKFSFLKMYVNLRVLGK